MMWCIQSTMLTAVETSSK